MAIGKAPRRRERNTILIAAAIVVVLIAGCGALTWYLWPRDEDKLDSRLCPLTGPIAHTVVLVDRTDPPKSEVQRSALLQGLAEIGNRAGVKGLTPSGAEEETVGTLGAEKPVAPGELLSVFVVTEDYKANAMPIFERCNPGLAESRDPVKLNIERLGRKFKHDFDDPWAQLVKRMPAESSAKHSPIMEMVQLAATNGFRRADVRGPRRLVIYSDMLQNTQYSMYVRVEPFDQFFKETYYRTVATDLDSVHVELRYIMLSPELQTVQLFDFWNKYFQSMGAEVVDVRTVQ